MEPDFCFQAQSPQTTFSFTDNGRISHKEPKRFDFLSSFQAFDDLSDSPFNVLQAFMNRIVETQPEKALHSNDTDDNDNFAPFRLTPEITGFTKEDNENHRTYTEGNHILNPPWMGYLKRKSSRNKLDRSVRSIACDAEDRGIQMLNDDEIVTSVQEESNPVDDETDEDEDNNESSMDIKC
ncbi:hypothetical protein TNCV_3158441 [Trichonephila clavipes]|nr:hypothetical protein TNCV_3158441 [Trichonephila clavipes]